MYLAFEDLSALFMEKMGVKEADHKYYTVCDKADTAQPRGLFIPLHEDSGELLDAIANGAIAVIWDHNKELPHYTPNHFPVFFTNDSLNAVGIILQTYIEKLDGERIEKMNKTNFMFFNKKLLKENNETYDIAVMLEKLSAVTVNNDMGRRE
jgi:hypothetical protein